MFPLQDSPERHNTPLATYVIIGFTALLFLMQIGIPEPALRRLFYTLGLVPLRYSDPAWAQWVGYKDLGAYQFVTYQFLHGGWLHVLGNLWMLWVFGDNVEDRMGPVRFLIFYLVCGVVAGWIHLLTNALDAVPVVGASGAIAGVLGAYFLLYPFARLVVMIPILVFPLLVEVPAIVFGVLWFLLQIHGGLAASLAPNSSGGIAWWAHVGGFVAGIVLLPFFLRRTPKPLVEDDRGSRRFLD